MVLDILIEIAKAVGKFFINPLLYLALFIAIILGYRRVKRERKFFHIRILWGWSEFLGAVRESFLSALLVTLIIVVLGLVLPVELLHIVVLVSIVGLISFSFYLLSPAVILPISFLLFMLVDYYKWQLSLFNYHFNVTNIDVYGVAVVLSILVGLFMIFEGLFIRKYGAKFTSPIIETSKRGKKAVAYYSKKLWILPIFFLVPGNLIENYFPYWPQFSLGYEQFSIILFPFVIGFQQKTRKTLPIMFYKQLGRTITICGEIVIILGLIGYFVPLIAYITLAIAFLVRLIIAVIYKMREKQDVYAVSPKSSGVTIIAVLPDSPAMKMGLLPGEVIRKVNGREVHNEKELYEALQINAAHCKLEVLNYNNEIRITQHVVYSDDHFRIGLLLTE